MIREITNTRGGVRRKAIGLLASAAMLFTGGIVATSTPSIAFASDTNSSSSANVSSIELNATELDLNIKSTFPLYASQSTGVTFSSSDENIATVDSTGRIGGIGVGTAVIRATASDGVYSTCIVHVRDLSYEGITVIGTGKYSTTVGQSVDVRAYIGTPDLTNPWVTWTSDDETVAKLENPSGWYAVPEFNAEYAENTIVATGVGTTTLHVSNGKETADITVTVTGDGQTAVSGVTMADGDQTLQTGAGKQLSATVAPSDASNTAVSWRSSDPTTVYVDGNGYITALKPGSATIYACAGGKNSSITVTVPAFSGTQTPVSALTISGDGHSVDADATLQLTAAATPSNATDKAVTWYSSDSTIAYVDANGLVTGIQPGSATITAVSASNVTASYDVTVTGTGHIDPNPVQSVTLNKDSLSVVEGGSDALAATVTPSDASNQKITWTSADPSIATVYASTGAVRGVKAGTTTVTATAPSGASATATVKVTSKDAVAATSVTFTADSAVTLDQWGGATLTLTEGGSHKVGATVSPENTTDKTLTWTSSNPTVASVSADGTVTGNMAGYASVYAKCGGVSGYLFVVANSTSGAVPVNGVEFEGDSAVQLNEGETHTYKTVIYPSDASNKTVTWKSSDPSVATVDANGTVTAVKAGTATITATSNNGEIKKGTVYVLHDSTKDVAVDSIALSPATQQIAVGATGTLSASYSPSNATVTDAAWSSAAPSVAFVDSDGTVRGIKAGSTTITLTAGGKTGTAVVTVGDGPTPTVDVTSVTLDASSLSLTEGDTQTLTATILPTNATNKSLTWTSSDPSVATVSRGVVTAVKAGTATITARSANGKTATAAVTVTPKEPQRVPVTIVSLTPNPLALTEGTSGQLKAAVLPTNATDKSLTWASSDPSVATVDANGTVTAVKAGTATVTATASNGVKGEATVIVTAKTPEIVDVTSVTLTPNPLALTTGKAGTLTAVVLPTNATDKTLTWTSSDPSVATVDANGLVTAVKAGTATVTATASNGVKGEATVTVTDPTPITVPVINVVLTPSPMTLTEGASGTLSTLVLPVNATDKTLTWESSDPSVATVDANGTVTAVKAGTATVTATATSGVKGQASIIVTAKTPETVDVTSVTLMPSSLSLTEGGNGTLRAIVLPTNATDKTLTWESKNPSVATVDANGTVTAIKEGTTTITATASNKVAGAAIVTVTAAQTDIPVTAVTLAPLSLVEGETGQIKATVTPANATDQTLTWESKNPSVATVDANGTVTAVKEGTAIVTATASNGIAGATAVTVNPKPAETVDVDQVTVSPTTLNLTEGETGQLQATVAPSNATDPSLTWTSLNPDAATVDQNGKVTAVKAGVAVIRATSVSNPTIGGQAVVTVAPASPIDVPVTSIVVTPVSQSVEVGSSVTISATALPTNATDKSITWSTGSDTVTLVDNGDGTVTVTGVKPGQAQVTAKSSNGVTSSAFVTVTEKVATTQTMYRLYNPNSSEHLFTADLNERAKLVGVGWNDEGEAWQSPKTGVPVYRVYNPNTGEHHYTKDFGELAHLVPLGWKDEGVCWYSAPESTGIPVYRLYNPNATANSHHYTVSKQERDTLLSFGWTDEGIGWYAVAE
ncbi:Ig-like domain-containing protein [Pseudoscardovia radai]|uniref:Ig-like domain-containing protein n=1 Tax=Pseudoscardovia radai TaxID=987066 RepID=UPI003995C7FC